MHNGLSHFSIFLLSICLVMIIHGSPSYAATVTTADDVVRNTLQDRRLTREQTVKVFRRLSGNGDMSLVTIDKMVNDDIDRVTSLAQTRSLIIEQLLDRGDLLKNEEQQLTNMLEESAIYNFALGKYTDFLMKAGRVGMMSDKGTFKNEEDYIHFMTFYTVTESLFAEFWSVKLWSLSISEERLNLCKSINELHITLINIKQSVDVKRSKSLMEEVRGYVKNGLNRISGKTYTEDIEKISVLFKTAILRAEAIPDDKSRTEFLAELQTRLELVTAKKETLRIQAYQKKAVLRIKDAWEWWENAEKEYQGKKYDDAFERQWNNHMRELAGINSGYLGTEAQDFLAEVKLAVLSIAKNPVGIKSWMIEYAHNLRLEEF